MKNYINLAKKAGLVVYGLDRCLPLAAGNKIGTIFYSAEVGKSARRELEFLKAGNADISFFELPDNEEMKKISDKEKVKILAIKRSKMLVKINALAKTLWSSDGKEV